MKSDDENRDVNANQGSGQKSDAGFDRRRLDISNRDFDQIVQLVSDLRMLSDKMDYGSNRKYDEAYVENKTKLIQRMLSLAADGGTPFAAVVYRLLQDPLSDDSINTISWLRNYLLMAIDQYKFVPFENTLLGVISWPLGFKMDDRISVSHWPELAKLSREVVLAYLENGSETAPEYLAKKAEFDPMFAIERDRFLADPVLGKSLRDKQFM